VVASLIVGGVFLLAMVIASVRGAVVLPAGARIPVHAGSVEHCYMAPKKAGLVIWPGAGALAFGVLGGVGARRDGAEGAGSPGQDGEGGRESQTRSELLVVTVG
jgi:hypothetical protein